ncbi:MULTISPECIES: iron chelate uptake ABC transporter family permease subunit [Mesorhizobium]|uniref:iron chelate uptake ABC transporter family permease subunit n=1 Tax=Mesorhizobium TaxID=68287 RepID=UPI001FCD597A|nr:MULTISPECIES: iron chelate uptake ABC transporter family permease subunit [Mesorhizobium]
MSATSRSRPISKASSATNHRHWSFVGLIAPHLARLVGFSRARLHLAGAMLLGALLMIVSDWLSRMAAFPYELPAGLFASPLGGPYLVYLLARGAARQG